MNKIIISGSSSGIGQSIAEHLLALQNTVVGLARQHDKFVPDTNFYQPFTIDFSQMKTLESALKELRQQHNDANTIIASAGYGQFAELEQWSLHDMQQIMNVNFLSQAMLIKTFLPLMKQKKQGRIIVIGSECALQGAKKASLYAASKFALRGFCQSLRQECSTANISVTLINPGLTRTPFFDELNFKPAADESNAITAQQIAKTVVDLLSLENNCVVEEINLQPMCKQIEKMTGA